MLITLVLVVAAGAPEDTADSPEPVELTSLSREQLDEELHRAEHARPSPGLFGLAGGLVGAGLLAMVISSAAGVHCTGPSIGFYRSEGLECTGRNASHTSWGDGTLATGIGVVIAGVVTAVLIGELRRRGAPRVDRVRAELQKREAVDEQQQAAEQRAREAVAPQELPAHAAMVLAIERRRPSVGPIIALMAGGLGAIVGGTFLAFHSGLPACLPTISLCASTAGYVEFGFGIAAIVVGLGLEVAGLLQIRSRRREWVEVDEQLDAVPGPVMEEELTPPPLPMPGASSKLPPAPVFIGWAFAF